MDFLLIEDTIKQKVVWTNIQLCTIWPCQFENNIHLEDLTLLLVRYNKKIPLHSQAM